MPSLQALVKGASLTLVSRFWRRVNRNGPVVRGELGPCWLWTGTCINKGYGEIGIGGRGTGKITTHRLSYILAHNRLPRHVVCHLCDVPNCVNPAHLVDKPRTWNQQDMWDKGRHARSRAWRHAAKLTLAQVRYVLTQHDRSARAIARELVVDKATICRIRHGETWQHQLATVAVAPAAT